MAGGSLAVTRLAHVSFATKDLSTQAEFYTERWGMEPIDEHGGEMFFHAETPEHHIFQLSSGDATGLGHVSFEVSSADDLDRAAELLGSRGVEIVTPPTAGLEPGIGKAMRFRDPEGNLVELVAGVDQVKDTYGARDVKPKGLNHVVLFATDMGKMEAFYQDCLGFRKSDELAHFMTFWRCNANHHLIAFCPAHKGEAGLHHAAFDTQDWREFLSAVFWMGERGLIREWGPGRHLAGNNLFSYYKDPEGNTVEWTAEVEQITDPDYVAPVRQPGPRTADQWGSRPPMAGSQ